MAHYILQDYDEDNLKEFLTEKGVPEKKLNEPQYFFNGAPMTINRKERIIESCDRDSILQLGLITNRRIIEIN